MGANLIAISPQNPDSSLSIKEKQELQFEVLSDKGNEAAKYYTTIIKNSIEAIDSATKLGVDFTLITMINQETFQSLPCLLLTKRV